MRTASPHFFMASLPGTNRLKASFLEVLQAVGSIKNKWVRYVIVIGLILFLCNAQSPVVAADGESSTIVTTENSSDTMHVVLPSGSFSDVVSTVTTVTSTTKE